MAMLKHGGHFVKQIASQLGFLQKITTENDCGQSNYLYHTLNDMLKIPFSLLHLKTAILEMAAILKILQVTYLLF